MAGTVDEFRWRQLAEGKFRRCRGPELPTTLVARTPRGGRITIGETQHEHNLCGSLIDLDDSEPYCWLTVRYDNEAFKEMLENGKYPDLILKPTLLELNEYGILAEADLGKTFKVRWIDFFVNRVWTGTHYDSNGALLTRVDSKKSDSKVWGLSCRGKDLHTSDLQGAFAGAVREISVLNP